MCCRFESGPPVHLTVNLAQPRPLPSDNKVVETGGDVGAAMAKLIYASDASLDGRTEDERGAVDWATPDDDVFAFITDLMRSAGTYLYGRRMYDTMAVWETDAGLAAQSDLMSDFANVWQAADKIPTPRPWPRCRPPRPGSNATSTPARSTT